MVDYYVMNIGGKDIKITSYDKMLQMEQGDCTRDHLTQLQYMASLFRNLGYDKIDKNLNWLNLRTPFEKVNKSIDGEKYLPVTYHNLFIMGPMSLMDLIDMIYIWGRGKAESGNILDYIHSYILPDEDTICFSLENNIKISRTKVVKNKVDRWLSTNIEFRRMYNLAINDDYFENSFINYTKFFKMAFIEDPIPLFAAGIIEPDFISDLIRRSEIEAAKKANKLFASPALRTDESMFDYFIEIFTRYQRIISDNYYKKGAYYFTGAEIIRDEKKSETIYITTPRNKIEFINSRDAVERVRFDLVNEKEWDLMKYYYLNDVEVTGEVKQTIFKYVDKKNIQNLPLNSEDDKNILFKNLFYVVDLLSKSYPESLDFKDKMVLSKGFFVSPDIFGLYNKSTKKFILVMKNLSILITGIKDAVDYYASLYNKDVFLDEKEIGDGLNSIEPGKVDYESMNKKSFIGKNEPNPGDIIPKVPKVNYGDYIDLNKIPGDIVPNKGLRDIKENKVPSLMDVTEIE